MPSEFPVLMLGGVSLDGVEVPTDLVLVGWTGKPPRWSVLFRGSDAERAAGALALFLGRGRGFKFWSMAECPSAWSPSDLERELSKVAHAPDPARVVSGSGVPS